MLNMDEFTVQRYSNKFHIYPHKQSFSITFINSKLPEP
jgi:hypothetical protein